MKTEKSSSHRNASTFMHHRGHFLMFASHICHLQVVFNLTVRVSESQLTSGEITSVDVEHMPVLCIIPNAENSTGDTRRHTAGIQEEDLSSKTHKNGTKCVCAPTRACAHIPAQRLVLLVLDVPGEMASNQERCLSFRVVTPSNVTAFPLSDATPPHGNNSSCASPAIFLERAGTAAVKLQAQAQVSPQNKSPMSCEKGNGEPSPDARAKLTWQPGAAEGPVPRPASDGEGVCKQSVPMEPFRKTTWSSERLAS